MAQLFVRAAALGSKGRSAQNVAWLARGFSSADATSSQSAAAEPPKLVVFGGRGFVGSHVCAEAVNSGLNVVGVSRGGTPPLSRDSWVGSVTWARGNALEPQSFSRHLEGADAVVSCIGAFGTQAEMLKLNGAANVSLIEAAKAAGVKRFVYVSAHIPNIPGIDVLLGGYIRGKQAAEEALRAHFPATGVALRPGAIYGDRVVSTNLTLPLGYAFRPIEALLQRMGPQAARSAAEIPLVGAAFVPPVSVEVVARVAVRAAMDPAVPGGVIDVWQLAAEAK
ncbi:hypothetical protein GPECTOR_89g504 [Gonium pectorale]|uniref:NAD(P)-binding domain-containing protein n=1 Tax=Gonium pectorale TaxID=33097 RepID=A0A150G0X1_GONPE|nr:hypothetical protein GPECTOR_89g504 [Gonium pectorale]|eukprot:KXZ43484.1 hypothetical protein GPECTOR_89g504 [Gonium pectorale]